jgi:hypothetical protein
MQTCLQKESLNQPDFVLKAMRAEIQERQLDHNRILLDLEKSRLKLFDNYSYITHPVPCVRNKKPFNHEDARGQRASASLVREVAEHTFVEEEEMTESDEAAVGMLLDQEGQNDDTGELVVNGGDPVQ